MLKAHNDNKLRFCRIGWLDYLKAQRVYPLLVYQRELVSAGLRVLDKARGRYFDRSIHDWSSLHINSVGKWFLTPDAPRVRVAGENFGVAFCALAD